MLEVQLTITAGERDLLVRILGDALKGKRVEVHRTEFSRQYRHDLEAEETEINGLLEKVSHAS
jgi:hypothetical protein